jgi:subtilisin family serine protease
MKFYAVLTMLVVSACNTENQKAREVMDAGASLPQAILDRANPQPSRELEDLVAAKDQNGRLTVAVIDNGVDYTHPQIGSQIKFSTDGGRISGAGIDILGEDVWASPNLIDASLFAFGAQAVQNGRISGPLADPLAELVRLNDEFMTEFLDAIRSNSRLRSTLFSTKITKDSINLFAIHRWVENKVFKIEEYKEAKENKKLITTEGFQEKVFEDKKPDEIEVRNFFELPWLMSSWGTPDTGLNVPSVAYEITVIEGADTFFELAESVFNRFTAKSGYLKKFDTYVDYQIARTSNPEDVKKEEFKKGEMGALSDAWYRVNFNFRNADNAEGFVNELCELLTKDEFNRLRDPRVAENDKDAIILKTIDRGDQWAEQLNQFVLARPDTTKNEKRQAKKNQEVFANFRSFARKYIELNGLKALRCDNYRNARRSQDPRALARAQRVEHPYWAGANEDESHGTHVTGIIAAQEAKLDILPVRVLTASTEPLKSIDDQLKADLAAGFAAWLQNPTILRGTAEAFSRSLQISKGSIGDPAQREVVAKKISDAFVEWVDETYSNLRLDVHFIREVKLALKAMGERRVKVANISLGTNFEKSVAPLNPDDLERERKTLMMFFLYEYFKSDVAKTANSEAPRTLFVIASGNDSAWVDGKSRSALPCDLSSSYFEKYAQGEQDGALESQRLKNVLCVGSLSPDKDISSYSNIPLTTVPFVFSYGEQILSSVKTTDCTGANQEASILVGRAPSYSQFWKADDDVGMVPDEKALAFLDSIGVKNPQGLTGIDLKRWQSRQYTKVMDNIAGLESKLVGLTTFERCLADNAPAARMSGTSMATPAVTGFMGRYIVKKMAQMSLQESDIYEMPEFAPETLIREVAMNNPRFGGNTLMKEVPTLLDINSYLREPLKNWSTVLGLEMLQTASEASDVLANVSGQFWFAQSESM